MHDAACDGYPVCCVRKDTCVSTHGGMISSNSKYYEGGCVSPNSRAKALPEGCAKQGECHAMYLEHMKAGTAKAEKRDMFGRIITSAQHAKNKGRANNKRPAGEMADKDAVEMLPVRFKYHEGVTDAVRRPVKVRDLL